MRGTAAVIATGICLMVPSAARAELTYDLRAADGGKAVQVDRVGQVVRLELYAIVQGHDGIDNETFYDGWVRIVSNDARALSTMRGDFAPLSH
jgi:hypothetical protein